MKNLTISLLAAWGASIRSFVDGDLFRESTLDLLWGDLADRLGYLKTAVDGKPDLSDTQTWTGVNTFSGNVSMTGSAVTIAPTASDLTIAPGTGITNVAGDVIATGTVDAGAFASTGAITAQEGYVESPFVLSDADQTVSDADHQAFRVPTLTAARIYTLSDPANPGVRVKFTRPGTAAFAATIRRADTTVLAVIDASNRASVTLRAVGSKWVVEDWTANVSSINADVS